MTDGMTPENPAENLGIPAEAVVGDTPAPAPAVKKKGNVVNPYTWGTGRRKAAVARVRIKPGDGKFMVNKKEVDTFFCVEKDQQIVRTPLTVTDAARNFDVFVNVRGGGTTGQAGAVVLGLARALAKHDPTFEAALRDNHLLSRDPRRVERKKYGQRGARRRFQFSKR